jgi:glutamate/aspartate transport system substrate-binding protein
MLKTMKHFAVVSFASLASIGGAIGQDLGPTLQKIKEAGAITIGHRDSSIPLSYLDGEQKPVGFSLDLCGLVVEKIKEKLALPDLKVNYQRTMPSDVVQLVSDGAVDIECGATAKTETREQKAAFSVTTYEPEFRWLVPRKLRAESEGYSRRRRETRFASSSDDLRGKTVVLTRGSSTTPLVLGLSSDRSLGLSIMQGKDNAESFALVESGKASAFLDDDVLLAGLKANAKNPDAYTFLEDSFPSKPYALVFRKDDRNFKELVDSVLTGAMKSGEYEKIYTKWFQSPIPPKNVNLNFPMSEKMKLLIKEPNPGH